MLARCKEYGGPDIEALEEYVSDKGSSCKLKIRDRIQAVALTARICGWFKQGVPDAESVTITLNIGSADDG